MKKIRLGLIGCGGIMHSMHIPSLLEIPDRYEVTALCDNDPARKQSTIDKLCKNRDQDYRKYLESRWFDKYEDVAKLKDVDAVILATPNYHHEKAVYLLMDEGKDVFCEKPVALTVEAHDGIEKKISETGRMFQVGMVFRYSPFFNTIKKHIDSGDIGKLQMIYLNEFRVFPPVVWRYKKELAGEVYLEKNCHHFDVFNWMVGQNVKPRKIVAFGGQNVSKLGSKKPIYLSAGWTVVDYAETIDNFFCTVEYENDVRCSLGLSFFSRSGVELKIGFLGDDGKIDSWEHEKVIKLWNDKNKNPNVIPQPEEGTEWYKNLKRQTYFVHYGSIEQLENFHSAIMERKEPFCNLGKARDSARLALAAEQSMITGQVVTFA